MSMNIAEKTDYSYLFNSLGRSGNSNSFYGVNLSDYASIKNGSYGKLLKAYYTKQSDSTEATSDSKKNDKTSTETTKLTAVATKASALQESAAKLIDKSSTSLFKEKDITTKNEDGTTTTQKGYDTEAIYKAASDFVSKYNAFVKSVDATSSKTLERENKSLNNLVSNYKNSLSNIGITLNEDQSLSIDEKKFKASDMTSVKSLFNGNTSFAYSVSTKASLMGTNASSEANTMKNYTSSGNYSDIYSAGNLLSSLV